MTLLTCGAHRVPSLPAAPVLSRSSRSVLDELQHPAHSGASHRLSAPLPYFLFTHSSLATLPPSDLYHLRQAPPFWPLHMLLTPPGKLLPCLFSGLMSSFPSGLCSQVIFSDVWASLATIFAVSALLSTFCSNISFYHLLLCFCSRAVNFSEYYLFIWLVGLQVPQGQGFHLFRLLLYF